MRHEENPTPTTKVHFRVNTDAKKGIKEEQDYKKEKEKTKDRI